MTNLIDRALHDPNTTIDGRAHLRTNGDIGPARVVSAVVSSLTLTQIIASDLRPSAIIDDNAHVLIYSTGNEGRIILSGSTPSHEQLLSLERLLDHFRHLGSAVDPIRLRYLEIVTPTE